MTKTYLTNLVQREPFRNASVHAQRAIAHERGNRHLVEHGVAPLPHTFHIIFSVMFAQEILESVAGVRITSFVVAAQEEELKRRP